MSRIGTETGHPVARGRPASPLVSDPSIVPFVPSDQLRLAVIDLVVAASYRRLRLRRSQSRWFRRRRFRVELSERAV